MSCKCQNCGNYYKVDVIVSNDLWEKIKPYNKPQGAGLLCGRCIMDRIEDLEEYNSFLLKEHSNSKDI